MSGKLLRDLAERAARTFAQAFLAAYGLDLASVLNGDLATKAAMAGGAAVLSLVMGLVGSRVGSSRDDGSVL